MECDTRCANAVGHVCGHNNTRLLPKKQHLKEPTRPFKAKELGAQPMEMLGSGTAKALGTQSNFLGAPDNCRALVRQQPFTYT